MLILSKTRIMKRFSFILEVPLRPPFSNLVLFYIHNLILFIEPF